MIRFKRWLGPLGNPGPKGNTNIRCNLMGTQNVKENVFINELINQALDELKLFILDSWFMVHGSWARLMAHGSWSWLMVMAHGQGSWLMAEKKKEHGAGGPGPGPRQRSFFLGNAPIIIYYNT